LNFGGRVKQASIKNFLLVVEGVNGPEKKVPNALVFGKIDEHTFSL
jgi:hypothetical protein